MFLKGVTASAVSAEGVAPAADWSTWERDGRAPRSSAGAPIHLDALRRKGRLALREALGHALDCGELVARPHERGVDVRAPR